LFRRYTHERPTHFRVVPRVAPAARAVSISVRSRCRVVDRVAFDRRIGSADGQTRASRRALTTALDDDASRREIQRA
jgi:hypothetical protein